MSDLRISRDAESGSGPTPLEGRPTVPVVDLLPFTLAAPLPVAWLPGSITGEELARASVAAPGVALAATAGAGVALADGAH